MASHNTRALRCPDCMTTHVIKLKRSGQMRCRDCGAGFTHEQAVQAAARWKRRPAPRASSGSGQLAGPAYHRGMRWGSFVPG